MNPDVDLFRRTHPRKKLEMIDSLTAAELLGISKDTVLSFVKETGTRRGTTRDKDFSIRHGLRQGNSRNSTIESLSLHKGRLYVEAYVQLDSTDTTDTVPFETFFARGDFRGTIKHSDRYGNDRHSYYVYDELDKAEVIRSICREYIHRKYKEQLG